MEVHPFVVVEVTYYLEEGRHWDEMEVADQEGPGASFDAVAAFQEVHLPFAFDSYSYYFAHVVEVEAHC